jgi:hypothetical protein
MLLGDADKSSKHSAEMDASSAIDRQRQGEFREHMIVIGYLV